MKKKIFLSAVAILILALSVSRTRSSRRKLRGLDFSLRPPGPATSIRPMRSFKVCAS